MWCYCQFGNLPAMSITTSMLPTYVTILKPISFFLNQRSKNTLINIFETKIHRIKKRKLPFKIIWTKFNGLYKVLIITLMGRKLKKAFKKTIKRSYTFKKNITKRSGIRKWIKIFKKSKRHPPKIKKDL